MRRGNGEGGREEEQGGEGGESTCRRKALFSWFQVVGFVLQFSSFNGRSEHSGFASVNERYREHGEGEEGCERVLGNDWCRCTVTCLSESRWRSIVELVQSRRLLPSSTALVFRTSSLARHRQLNLTSGALSYIAFCLSYPR